METVNGKRNISKTEKRQFPEPFNLKNEYLRRCKKLYIEKFY